MGGSHRALYDLVRSLSRERYEPVVAFYQANSYVELLRAMGIEVVLLDDMRSRELQAFRSAGKLRRRLVQLRGIARRSSLLSKHRIDLLHVINSPIVGSDDWLPAACLTGIPCISSAMGHADSHMYQSRIRRWMFGRYERVLAVSRHTASRLMEAGVPPEIVDVVHHGVDMDGLRASIAREPAAVRADLDVPPGAVLVTMVGNLRRWKGQHLLLEGLGELDRSVLADADVRVVLAGKATANDETYVRELVSRVEQGGLTDRVQFLGFREDVPQIINASDIVVHASVEPEPGGIAVLEAMALGTAVIAADAGGHTEVLTPECGLLFEIGSARDLGRALNTLVRRPRLRSEFGRKAAARMRHFTIEENARATEAVYEEVLG